MIKIENKVEIPAYTQITYHYKCEQCAIIVYTELAAIEHDSQFHRNPIIKTIPGLNLRAVYAEDKADIAVVHGWVGAFRSPGWYLDLPEDGWESLEGFEALLKEDLVDTQDKLNHIKAFLDNSPNERTSDD